MAWALLLLLCVVIAVHWFEYKRSIQEYTFAQPKSAAEIRGVISEKTPIVAEIGALPWRSTVATDASWPISNSEGVEMPISEWLKQEDSSRQPISNGSALAETMELSTGLSEIDESRRWWWIPGLHDLTVDMLGPGETLGLHWTCAERHWIGCSDGEPLTLWLVHSRYKKFLPTSAENPWALTVAEAPWIGRVQYIEVIVRPGWCVGVPAHWGVAARSEATTKSGASSWVWTANQHSPLSLSLANLAV
jgi:hypothetical protein